MAGDSIGDFHAPRDLRNDADDEMMRYAMNAVGLAHTLAGRAFTCGITVDGEVSLLMIATTEEELDRVATKQRDAMRNVPDATGLGIEIISVGREAVAASHENYLKRLDECVQRWEPPATSLSLPE